jgi:hypothetical protein
MWRQIALVFAVLTLNPAVASLAGKPDVSLLSRQSWVRFDIVLGRLVITHLRAGHGRTTNEPEGTEVREALAISNDPTTRSLRYDRVDASGSIELQASDGVLRIVKRAVDCDRDWHVRFVQEAGRPVRLSVIVGEAAQEYHFATVWHLLLAEPDVCRMHFIPLLELLRPDWRIRQMSERIETELLRRASREPQISPKEVARFVEQLDSREFVVRQTADNNLRNLGVSVLPYLARSREGLLSGEQRLRLTRICKDLSATGADTPTRVGAWLAHDHSVWLEYLSHERPAVRQAAADRLAGIHSKAITVDPLETETQRRNQIAEIRTPN